jgi:hypothetical protein
MNKVFECPIDKLHEIRNADSLSTLGQFTELTEFLETSCEFHPDRVGDMFCNERESCLCEYCVRCFDTHTFKDTNTFDASTFYGEKIMELQS